MKGEPKKFDKSKVNKPAKFPLRTFPIGREMLQYNSEFFDTYHFISIMFIACIGMFAVTSTLQALQLEQLKNYLQSNQSFFIMLLLLVLIFSNLTKNTFNLGYFKYTQETKMELLLAVKAFIIVFVTLKYVNTKLLFDYDLVQLHTHLAARIDSALYPFGFAKKTIPFEYTAFVFAIICALISFSIVKVNIKFAYYFFNFTSSDNSDNSAEENSDELAAGMAQRVHEKNKRIN